MKKAISVVAILLAAALVFAAGGEGRRRRKITSMWESNNGPDDLSGAGEFTKKYPNITINYVHVELGDAADRLL